MYTIVYICIYHGIILCIYMIHIVDIYIHYYTMKGLCQAHPEFVENIIRRFVNDKGTENVRTKSSKDTVG